ncbi:hypothetical protein CAAN1_04S07822 [[Candida] anglica]|uniref:Major facilitator superfamily (MFS) profile domain-containing protein n=1 Tax=[Candida] anglica TaxID=148631 RepID=A0ABP0E8A5_9ASCO
MNFIPPADLDSDSVQQLTSSLFEKGYMMPVNGTRDSISTDPGRSGISESIDRPENPNTGVSQDDGDNASGSHVTRRQSIRPSDRTVSESVVPLYNSIIQNIPESLPTTPGYEVTQKMFEQDMTSSLPTQRPNLYRKDTQQAELGNSWSADLGGAITRLLTNQRDIGSIRENDNERSVIEVESEPVDETTPVMTFRNPPKNLWRVCACCIWAFTNGFSDGTPGALLPFIEEYYNVSYSVVSLIWMSNAVGFIMVALFSHKIEPWFTKRQALTLGCVFSTIMFAFVSTGYKFPLIVCGFFFGGVGVATCLSQMNVFMTRLEKSSTALGYFHGVYGLGATVSPLIGTSFINNDIPWHYFYLILVGLSLTNAINIWFSFEGSDEDLAPWDNKEDVSTETVVKEEEEAINTGHEETVIGLTNLGRGGKSKTSRQGPHAPAVPHGDMAAALSNRITWLISFFVLFYQGSEVSMGGWIVTYLLNYRHGNPKSVGYVASGFWLGLTLGRLALTRPFHKYVGARRGIIIMSVLSILFVVLTWAIPSVITAGVFVSLAGVFIGPTYPLMISLAARMLPRKIQVVSLTIMTAFGSSGGAIFPFFVGLISQFAGAFVVLPIFIGLYTLMLIIWICLPNVEGRERYDGKMTWWQRIW